MLLQADPDIFNAMREPGFQQWLIYAFIAFVLWDKISARFERNKAQPRVVTGSIESREPQTPALKSEVEDELEDLGESISGLRDSMSGLRDHIDARMDDLNLAGEGRLGVITAHINREITAIRQEIESRASLLHEKINSTGLHVAGHEEAIGNLKATDFRHDQVIQAIQAKLATARKPS